MKIKKKKRTRRHHFTRELCSVQYTRPYTCVLWIQREYYSIYATANETKNKKAKMLNEIKTGSLKIIISNFCVHTKSDEKTTTTTTTHTKQTHAHGAWTDRAMRICARDECICVFFHNFFSFLSFVAVVRHRRRRRSSTSSSFISSHYLYSICFVQFLGHYYSLGWFTSTWNSFQFYFFSTSFGYHIFFLSLSPYHSPILPHSIAWFTLLIRETLKWALNYYVLLVPNVNFHRQPIGRTVFFLF